MKVLVCGSRHFNDFGKLSAVLSDCGITHLIQGGAKGADRLSMEWALQNAIPQTEFKADWNVHGKRAGPIRNYQMLKEGKPEMVVAFLAPNSRGTKHMIEIAQKAGVKTIIVDIGNDTP